MTNLKWMYVAKGHYSAKDGDWLVHVLENGAVYKTHSTRAAVDVEGAKAERYIESVPAKFPIRGRMRAEPKRETKEPAAQGDKPTAKPKGKKKPKRRITAAAKKLAAGAGAIIGTTRAFVTDVGEAEERAYEKRKAPAPKKKAAPAPKKKVAAKPKKKKPKPPANGRPTIVRRKKPTTRRIVPAPVTEHPLQYLISGGEALPPTRRRTMKKRREMTLEEFMGR